MLTFNRILVTGADGFVGRHLLPHLREAFPQATLVAAVRHAQALTPRPQADEVLPFDLLQPEQCSAMITAARPDGLVHLAAQASVAASFAAPLLTWQANLIGTVALAEAVLLLAPRCRFVLASSAEVYGLSFQAPAPLDETAAIAPANPYAAAKAACDLAIGEMALRGFNAIRLRAFNQIGPGQSESFVIPAFARQLALIEAGLQEPVVRVGALDRFRDFIDVTDVCAAYAAALRCDAAPGTVYNIASGTARRLSDVLEALIGMTALHPAIMTDPRHLRPTDLQCVTGDGRRALSDLGWAPVVPWEQTLQQVLEFWRRQVAGARAPC